MAARQALPLRLPRGHGPAGRCRFRPSRCRSGSAQRSQRRPLHLCAAGTATGRRARPSRDRTRSSRSRGPSASRTANVFEILSTADVGLSPDPLNPLNDVSTMNKTMEYMSFRLPVVAFDLKETKFSAGQAAVYVRTKRRRRVRGWNSAGTRRSRAPRDYGRFRSREDRRRALAWHHQAPRYVTVYESLTPRGRTSLVRPGPAASSSSHRRSKTSA